MEYTIEDLRTGPFTFELVGADLSISKGITVFLVGLGVFRNGQLGDNDLPAAIQAIHRLAIPPDETSLFVDLHDVRPDDPFTLRALPMADQASRIAAAVDFAVRRSPLIERINLVAQSAGTLTLLRLLSEPRFAQRTTGGLLDKVILMAPPTFEDGSHLRWVTEFEKREGTKVNYDGESVMMCRGGYRIVVPASYWEDIMTLQLLPRIAWIRDRCRGIQAFFASEDIQYPKGWVYYLGPLSADEMHVLSGNSHSFRYPDMQKHLLRVLVPYLARVPAAVAR